MGALASEQSAFICYSAILCLYVKFENEKVFENAPALKNVQVFKNAQVLGKCASLEKIVCYSIREICQFCQFCQISVKPTFILFKAQFLFFHENSLRTKSI
jgi:hypothetical protein